MVMKETTGHHDDPWAAPAQRNGGRAAMDVIVDSTDRRVTIEDKRFSFPLDSHPKLSRRS